MHIPSLLLMLTLLVSPVLAEKGSDKGAEWVQTPYEEQKVVFDFYFDHPEKINSALYWIRSLMNPLMESPYEMAPEFLDLKVIVHGTETVTLAKHNAEKYEDAVQRMRYYHSLGVEFIVCGLAMADFGYRLEELQDFVRVVPSAITELAHWQLQGYAVITPQVLERKFAIEDIR